MLERPKLLLVVAQSGRMLAQSAAREGYLVRVADCFGDRDTLRVADRYLKLLPLDKITKPQWLQTIISLSDGQSCSLICGTGIERFYPMLAELPAHIKFAGTSIESFQQICVPEQWTALLDKLNLSHPPTTFNKDHPLYGKWLAKAAAAWGGTHVVNAHSITEQTDVYYQQQINGMSASVLFLANGSDFHVLLLNQQFNVNAELNNFGLQGISNNLQLDEIQQHDIFSALQKLTLHLNLSGLMSLDFMLDSSGRIFLLEINPRPTASCQLLPIDFPIISWHLLCTDGVMPEIDAELLIKKRILWFCFAPEKIIIPENFDWPDYCYDLPVAGSTIDKGGIICSLLLEQTDANAMTGHLFANKLIENLSTQA